MNPLLYFVIFEDCLVPVKGTNPVLEACFGAKAVQNDNKKNYNDYTRNFLLKHKGSFKLFMSDDYEYNSSKHTFNFNSIEEVEDAESRVFNNPLFKHFKDYNFPNAVKTDAGIIEETKPQVVEFTPIEEIMNKYPIPSIEECGMYIDKFVWKYLVRNILKKKNTILVGPTGTGKTELVMMIAKHLNIECHVYDMGSMQDPLTDLLGSHRLENGSSVFDYAKFTEHVQKPCIIVLDELSRAPLMANNILFPCLDSRRELPIEIADSKSIRNIKVHPDCVFIATANIGIEYSGTSELDAALFNRFLPLQLDYMPAENEIEVLVHRTGVDKNQATKIVNFANRIRNDYKSEILTKSCSSRESIAMAEMVADGFSFLEAFRSVITYKYSNPDDEEANHINRLLITL